MQELITLPEKHFNTRVKNQYSNIPLAISREILQNSIDAGASRIDIDTSDNGFCASDNGKGMNLEEFRQYYLTLGGTRKDSGSIGGFGAAKEVLSFAWANWACKGNSFSVIGQYCKPPESATDNSLVNGFMVSARDDTLDGLAIANNARRIIALSDFDCKVYINGARAESGRKLQDAQIVQTFSFGKLYHVKRRNSDEEPGMVYTRSKGLFTAQDHIGGAFCFYLELTGRPQDTLTESRDGLRYGPKGEVSFYVQSLTRDKEKSARLERRGGEDKSKKPTLTVYASINTCSCGCGEPLSSGNRSQYTGNGFSVDYGACIDGLPAFAIANETGKAINILCKGKVKPELYKAIRVWDYVLGLVSGVLNLQKPVCGLYFGTDCNAFCTKVNGVPVIVAMPERIIGDAPFALLELAIHELTHYDQEDHSQDYESARMAHARTIAPLALSLLTQIARYQAAK